MSSSPDSQKAGNTAKLSRRQRLRSGITSSVGRVLAEGIEETPQEKAGYYESIPLDEIDTDPANPRWERRVPPTWNQILNPESITEEELKDDVEYIHGLAQSMAPPVGQTTPGDVYRRGGRYLIISGECRYWALRLRSHWSGQPGTFNAVIRPDPPEYISLLQYLENYKRRSPLLPQQLGNLQGVVSEFERQGRALTDAKKFAEAIGSGQVMGYRWWAVLHGPEDVRAAMKSGQITSIQYAYTVAGESDANKRAQMISSPAARGESEAQVAITASAPATAASRAAKRGRPTTYLALGRTRSSAVAKHLLMTLDPDGDYSNVDWSNFKAISQCWDKLMKRLEKHLDDKLPKK